MLGSYPQRRATGNRIFLTGKIALQYKPAIVPGTLFEKIWRDHVVRALGRGTCLLCIDRNFLHEVSGSVSFKSLAEAGRTVRRPELTWATVDHVLDTFP